MHIRHTLTTMAVAAALAASSSAQAQSLTIGGTKTFFGAPESQGSPTTVFIDSALSGLALSNGSSNPFAAQATSERAPSGVVTGLNIIQADVRGLNGASVGTSTTTYGTASPQTERHTVTFLPKVSGLDVDNRTGDILKVYLDGTLAVSAPQQAGVSAGGSLQLSDLRLNLAAGVITADVVEFGATDWRFPGARSEDVALFNIGQIQGASRLNWQGMADVATGGDAQALLASGWRVVQQSNSAPNALGLEGWLELSRLTVTEDGLGMFAGSLVLESLPEMLFGSINSTPSGWGAARLGLGVRSLTQLSMGPDGVSALAPVTLNAASLSLPVTAAVPEPGSAALMLVGLVGIGTAAARKRKGVQAH